MIGVGRPKAPSLSGKCGCMISNTSSKSYEKINQLTMHENKTSTYQGIGTIRSLRMASSTLLYSTSTSGEYNPRRTMKLRIANADDGLNFPASSLLKHSCASNNSKFSTSPSFALIWGEIDKSAGRGSSKAW